jgi:AraC-like DNA-binding protein
MIDAAIEELIGNAEFHIDPSGIEVSSQNGILGTGFFGERVALAKADLTGISRFLFRSPDDTLVIAIAESGKSSGVAARNTIKIIPGRFSFLLLPHEVLKLTPQSPKVSGYVFKFSAKAILEESLLHSTENPSLSTLIDTLPGHETLLTACANQLIGFASYDQKNSELLTQPLEASIFSLIASLVATTPKQNLAQGLPDASTHSRYVQIALSYIEDNIAESITLSDLCQACCVSARTLQISFQSVMNRSPLQVLQELRLTQLRDLLLRGEDVSPACRQVGLQSSGRLSASYKKLFNELPRQTRQRGLFKP